MSVCIFSLILNTAIGQSVFEMCAFLVDFQDLAMNSQVFHKVIDFKTRYKQLHTKFIHVTQAMTNWI